MGGTDGAASIPYDVLTPRKSDCENMLALSGIAATHVAFASYRMEFTAGQIGQSAAHAIKIAMANGNQALQDVGLHGNACLYLGERYAAGRNRSCARSGKLI